MCVVRAQIGRQELVVRGETLVGIITDSDFVAVAINLLEQMEEAEPVELGDIA